MDFTGNYRGKQKWKKFTDEKDTMTVPQKLSYDITQLHSHYLLVLYVEITYDRYKDLSFHELNAP